MNNTRKKTVIPDPESLAFAAECLRALAHPVRLKILFLLESNRLTVGELAKECDILSHVASEHLRLMQRCGMLSVEKDGQKTYYQICETHVHAILDCMRTKFTENETSNR
jgi:DNA-binding transcriptional ArsR family regulator